MPAPADTNRMPNSIPPPGHSPTPVKQPNYLLRGIIATAGLIALLAVFLIATAPAGACVVNGMGNKLCGADARAYCELLDRQGQIDSFGIGDTAIACESVGYKQDYSY